MRRFYCLLLLVAAAGGCKEPAEVPPGTRGVVQADGVPLADVEVQIYLHQPTAEPLGFGVTDASGRFQLRLPGLKGPLHLEPGEYRVTLATAGEIYLSWPSEFSDPLKTPLRVSINTTHPTIELDVPMPKARY